jgi:hypothetical protein
MKIFKKTPYANKSMIQYVSEDGSHYTDNAELQTEYRIPQIKARRLHQSKRFNDILTNESFTQYIWRYVAEKIFYHGKWHKLNYYMMTSSMVDYSILSIGQSLHFEFSISKQLIA